MIDNQIIESVKSANIIVGLHVADNQRPSEGKGNETADIMEVKSVVYFKFSIYDICIADAQNFGTLNSRSTTGTITQMVDLGKTVFLHSCSVASSGTLSNDDPVSVNVARGIQSTAGQSKEGLTTHNFGNSTVINRTQNEGACASVGKITLESQERKTSPLTTEAISRTASTVPSTAPNLQSAGNMSNLVRLVNSVSNADAPKTTSLLTSTKVASGVSLPPPAMQVLASPTAPAPAAAPVTHLPRKIAMKQPPSTVANKLTSIVLNLKPGEALPKALNLLGPDGKSVVVLTLPEGGKQLVSPVAGGKVLIPIPANVVTPIAAPPKAAIVNKVYPIAPPPAKTTVSSPQTSVTPRLLSVSGSSLKPTAPSTVLSSVASSSASVSSLSQTRLSVVSAGASGSVLGSSVRTSPATVTTPTNLRPLEPKLPPSTAEQSTGLSPQDAKIQRLKELIKRQEEAVNKLREKRRLEIDRIRDPSLTSKQQDDSGTEDSLKSERVPLAEQKRPSSPFAVPLPPKKRMKDYDSSFKPKASNASDTSATPDGAFIPNADDKSFVQLVGLENVVNSIK